MRGVCVIALSVLAACAAPEAEVGVLSEQDLPENVETLDALPDARSDTEAKGGGFLARLLGQGKTTPEPEATEPDFTLTGDSDAGEAPDIPVADGEAAKSDDGETEIASLTRPETYGASQEIDLTSKPARRGLLGGLFSGGAGSAPQDAVAKSDVRLGTLLPYGRVARICDVPKNKLGQRVERFPERRAKYVLYDSEPGSTALRTFYLTGFRDGCARQFSAAVAILGSASLHEQLRYGLPAEVQPYSDTDKAYEDLKVRVCKVPRRKPCGSKIGRLEDDTVFVSIYERFGSNAHWSNLLVHDGALLAQDKKGL